MQKYTKYAVFDVRRYINFSDFSSFIFKAPIEKVASLDEEELHGIEIDGILNLDNISRTVFIN